LSREQHLFYNVKHTEKRLNYAAEAQKVVINILRTMSAYSQQHCQNDLINSTKPVNFDTSYLAV